jgi:hypothetical protein
MPTLDGKVLSLLQITSTCVTLLVAAYVWHASRRVSGSLRLTKRMNDLETTTADLQSSFQTLLESHKRLRSRAGMRELREREAQPGPETKAQVRKRLFGVAAGPAFAARQAQLNGRDTD